jgi:hypothetical protein
LDPDDSELRARITKLDDVELARMLTVDADNYRDEALALGREEVARRKLDLASFARGLEPTIQLPPKPKRRISLLFTRPFPVNELAGFGWAVCLIVISIALETFGPTLTKLGSAQERSLYECVLLAGIVEYLRIVYRMHRALQLATEGGYPVTPRFAVSAHFIPVYNIYWLHGWTVRVFQCAAKNGRVPTSPYILPTAMFVLGLLPGFHSLSMRVGLFFAAAKITQDTLLRVVREKTADASA